MNQPRIKPAILGVGQGFTLPRTLTLSTIVISCSMGCGGTAASRLPPSIARPFTMEQMAQQKRNRLCAMHNEPLREGRVVVRRGDPRDPVIRDPSLDYFNAIDLRFPHCESARALRSHDEGEPEVVEVLYCQRCRDAEEAWRAVWFGER